MSGRTRIGILAGLAALLLVGIVARAWWTGPATVPSARPAAHEPSATIRGLPTDDRPPLPAAPAQERASLPPSFQVAGDFHAFATEALKSSDGGAIFEGFQALRECEGMQADANDLRIVADGGAARGIVHGEVTEERRNAIRDVLRRCESFSRIDYRERRALITALQKRGQELGAVEFGVTGRPDDQLTRDELIALLESASPAARQLALRPLLQAADAARLEGPEGIGELDTARGLGFLLAACELGGYCGPDSYQASMMCAQVGVCGKSLLEGWQKESSDARIAQVDAFRRQVLDAVRTHDYSALGF